MTKEELKQILDVCSSCPEVREDIFKNHDNNMWWPLEVEDYRKRLLIAGLSTRISYSMINSYKKIIDELNSFSYDEITNMSEEQIVSIIKGLGLSNTRYKYMRSMIEFINNYETELLNMSNEQIIELIAKNVNGASYKVAQCCVLYMRGYYESGIMPVDSGMKDVELPCLGFESYKNALGHDKLRKELQDLVDGLDLEEIIIKNGYSDLDIPDYKNATWWAHLVLIYYKRHYCNKHKPDNCPLYSNENIKTLCLCNRQKDRG